MGTERPTNEKIHIGDIFMKSLVHECGSCCWFYQVVGLRGKTLVDVRQIKVELFKDEECRKFGKVKVRPLPGQFETEEVITLSVSIEAGDDGRNSLRERGRRGGSFYYQVLGDEVGHMTGYDADYALKALEREGRLPGSC